MLKKAYILSNKFYQEKVLNCSIRGISRTPMRLFCEDFNYLVKSLGSKFNMAQINDILSSYEEHVDVSQIVPRCPVKEIYINQLPANLKVEDRWNVGVNQLAGEVTSLLVGMVDGHSGKDCAQVVNKGALEYIAAACLNPDKLLKSLNEFKENSCYVIVRRFHPAQWESFNDSVKSLFMKSLFKYMEEMIQQKDRIVEPGVAMKEALMRLDKDMCMPNSQKDLQRWFESRPLLRLSLSGAVALFIRLYWLGEEGEANPTIHVANVGDCQAILAQYDKASKRLIAKSLNTSHTLLNKNELNRIIKEHPEDDPNELIRDGRLLGELMPTRSFGDVRYKWPKKWLCDLDARIKMPGSLSIYPKPYTNPPYLTAEPEITRFVIDPELDKFIVVATDSLWDVLTVDQVKDIVDQCPKDHSPATQLVKHALSGYSGTNDIDVQKLSMHLAMQSGLARYFRDDITVMVLKF